MIELTEKQIEAIEHSNSGPTHFVNPRTKETFVLVRVDEYKRVNDEGYDDSPWTRKELQALAWKMVKQNDWDEYDHLPEVPRSGAMWSLVDERFARFSPPRVAAQYPGRVRTGHRICGNNANCD